MYIWLLWKQLKQACKMTASIDYSNTAEANRYHSYIEMLKICILQIIPQTCVYRNIVL